MAADRSLTELDEAAGDDIGAFDRDADRHATIKAAKIIEGAFDDALAAMDVHRVVDGNAHALSCLRFHNGGDDRRMMSIVKPSEGNRAPRIKQIGIRRHASEPLLDRLEP